MSEIKNRYNELTNEILYLSASIHTLEKQGDDVSLYIAKMKESELEILNIQWRGLINSDDWKLHLKNLAIGVIK